MKSEHLDPPELYAMAKTLEARAKLIPIGLVLHRHIWRLAAHSLMAVADWERGRPK